MSPVDPLFDTLFRSTAPPSSLASAAPVRQAGTRSRAGNAMNRTRAALLDGARHAVQVSGTRITMAQVAAAAGVAKATLYNHFRTREAVLAALLAEEVTTLVEAQAERPLADALAEVAGRLSRHPVLRALARIEPGTLAAIGRVDLTADGWRIAQAGLAAVLARDSRGGTAMVLRWLASFVMSPADDDAAVAADLAILLAGLPDAPTAEAPTVPAEPVAGDSGAGVAAHAQSA